MPAVFSKWRTPAFMSFGARWTEALRTGRNQNEAKDSGDIFASLYADPAKLRGFLAAMSGVSLGAAQAIAAKFPWQNYKSFADIGAAQGMVAATLASAHPHLSGAGYDLPQVKPVFEEFIGTRGVSSRVKFISGNFFTELPPGGRCSHHGPYSARLGLGTKTTCCLKKRTPPSQRAEH